MMITLDGHSFKDETGRTLILRGVNLGGSSKVPTKPDGATWNKAGFYDHRSVSFVGRPFPLSVADEHFKRLRAWGFTFLRLITTWEAIEHAGPGQYDQEYLDYLYAIVKKAGEYGMDLFIDPHQDAWSRFTGGDGAPGWTLELAGFDAAKIHATGAAILHQERGDPFPGMVWPTNYNKLASATLFTLFFAGSDFAPQLTVEGQSIQEYLQSHYFNAIKQMALRLKDLPNLVGFDTLNEPSNGYIGEKDIHKCAQGIPIQKDNSPTVLQGMLLGAGYPQTVDVYDVGLAGMRKSGSRLINPEGEKVWLPGHNDIWRQHGIWGLDPAGNPVVLQPAYFSQVNGRAVDFYRDYFKPFVNRFAREIRSILPNAIIFVEGVPSQGELTWGPADEACIVHAPHWYDGLTLLTKNYTSWVSFDSIKMRLVLGPRGVRQSFVSQIAEIIRQSEEQMNHAPTLIGEVGIPFDMQKKKAYRTGNFVMQINALDATLTALERNFVSFTLWNYTADNSNARGDLWNDEDLSIFSPDQMTGSGSIYDGGRALKAALRPYPTCISGEPLSLSFDIRSGTFEFTFRHSEGSDLTTELFVPAYQYPLGCTVMLSDGTYELDQENQILRYHHTTSRSTHSITLTPA